ncbi:hypothetical protein EC957_009515 [Mortierella hygrophila]|uniref:Uncharacterized protein n=1 Tax=Mortierella hygrophila TaxID=979708 RepID=A0A9P6JXW3_9FUNG|nr:hypothetical protein EC957_009515 [Mortierella hygrophila]
MEGKLLVQRATFTPRSIDDSTQSWGYILHQITDPRPQPPPPAAINAATGVTTATAPGSSRFRVHFIDTHESYVRDSDLIKGRDWLFAIFEKYGHHIRELKINHALVLEAASRKETCTSLHTLVLDLGQNAKGPCLRYLPLPSVPPQRPQLPVVPGFSVMVGTPGLDATLAVVPDATAGGFGIAPTTASATAFGGFGIAPALHLLALADLALLPPCKLHDPIKNPTLNSPSHCFQAI